MTGTLEAQRTVLIYNEEVGRIIELPFYEGDAVATGAALVRLDDALIRAELDKAVANRRQAEVDLKRIERLIPRKLASEDELATARTALELARAEESLQRTRLSRTLIEAPFDGLVSARLFEPGDVVPLHSHILTFIDPASLRAKVHVSELLLPFIAEQDAVRIRIDALGDKTFEGRVLRVHPTIDPDTRQGTVEVALAPIPDGAIPGQLCRVILDTPALRRMVIPFAALRHDTHGAYVYRVGPDGKALRTPVRTGLQIGNALEVQEGLEEGAQVVVKGFLGLRDGKQVKVIHADG